MHFFPHFTVTIYIFHVSFFMLHFFRTEPFHCCTFLCSNLFMFHFFSYCTLFTYCNILYCTFTCRNVFVLHFSLLTLFARCNFFLLHFLHFALFPEVKPGPQKISKMESFVTIINKAVKCWSKTLHLRCSRESWLHLYYFHVVPFSCRILFVLHFFRIEKKWKLNERQKT